MAQNRTQHDGPLQAALQESTEAAATRATEGHKIFSPIAALLDKHCTQSSSLAPHLQRALTLLSNDLAAVAQLHFAAFVCEKPPPRIPLAATTALPSPPVSRSSSCSPPAPANTFATIASSAKPGNAPTVIQHPKKAPSATKQLVPDNRLFVRLPPGHKAKEIQAYAIFSGLRIQLGSNSSLLKEVQATKTGFALCPPSSDSLPALEAHKEAITSFFGECQIERSSRWVSYRVTNVPRKIGQFINNAYTLISVDSKAMSCAVAEATGFNPISVTETTASTSNSTSPSSSWFVNFPEGVNASLPRQLRLFGTVTNARLLAKKTTIIQCNKCWKWHNARSCARPPRCRLCGSTEHLEEGHSNRCVVPNPHQCPPRCLHCHGPHPADHSDCLLRPSKARAVLSKSQISEIRRSCSATLTQTRINKGCQAPAETVNAIMEDIAPTAMPRSQAGAAVSQPATPTPFYATANPIPTTPPPPTPLARPPSTARAVRFSQNMFDDLPQEEL